MEGNGIWNDNTLNKYSELVKEIPGVFAEIGVAYGDTFNRLIPIAHNQNKELHGFDSFEGMSAPGEFDTEFHYKGKFNAGGIEGFKKRIKNFGYEENRYVLHKGFTPSCFIGCEDIKFSFVIIDVDHYKPTKHSLEFIFPRLSNSGILLLDDYMENRNNESTKAIKEFIKENNDLIEVLEYDNCQLIIRKKCEEENNG